jgi:hypothetical protein
LPDCGFGVALRGLVAATRSAAAFADFPDLWSAIAFTPK